MPLLVFRLILCPLIVSGIRGATLWLIWYWLLTHKKEDKKGK